MKLVNADAFTKEYSANPPSAILLGHRNNKAFDAGRAAERSVLLETLSKFQTIDPESLRPSATWIVKQTASGKEYAICSRCKMVFRYKTHTGELENIDMRGCAYCPACGARMPIKKGDELFEKVD